MRAQLDSTLLLLLSLLFSSSSPYFCQEETKRHSTNFWGQLLEEEEKLLLLDKFHHFSLSTKCSALVSSSKKIVAEGLSGTARGTISSPSSIHLRNVKLCYVMLGVYIYCIRYSRSSLLLLLLLLLAGGNKFINVRQCVQE